MYNQFFGLKERPFKLVPNPAYLYLSRIHEEVLAHLNYAVAYGEGFVAITGEVGTGKTTLCRMFLENLEDDTEAAYIFNPKLDAIQLLKAINDEFAIPSDTNSVKRLIDRFNRFLLEKKAQNKRVVLLVDEAQNLQTDVLEQLRLLSNLETTTSKLLQIILVGQPELDELLETDGLRQLSQRISLSCHLVPLSFAETRAYIDHRIHIASHNPGLSFTKGAFRSIFRFAGGVPRRINIVCERSLLIAFTQGKREITQSLVKQAINELEGKIDRSDRSIMFKKPLAWGLLAFMVVVAVALIFGMRIFDRFPITMADTKTSISSGDPSPSPTSQTVSVLTEDPEAPDTMEPGTSPPPSDIPVSTEPEKKSQVATQESETIFQPAAPGLEQVLAETDGTNSREQALRAVLNQWKRKDPTLLPLPMEGGDAPTYFRVAAKNNALEYLRVQGNLNLIKKLNLPAILEFPREDGGGNRYLAVIGLPESKIRLSNGDVAFDAEPESIADAWNGTAHVLWRNFYNYTGIIPVSSPGEVILSFKVHLKNLGYPMRSLNPAYDTATRMVVEKIQRRNGLDADGMVGPLTKIVLYNEDHALTIPRLVESSAG